VKLKVRYFGDDVWWHNAEIDPIDPFHGIKIDCGNGWFTVVDRKFLAEIKIEETKND